MASLRSREISGGGARRIDSSSFGGGGRNTGPTMKKSRMPKLVEALRGHPTDHLRFLLQMHLGQIARLAIIVFVGAMALQQMGIAASIVNLAFGLLLGAIAVAMAISFGLGGRDVASEQLRDWMTGFRDKK